MYPTHFHSRLLIGLTFSSVFTRFLCIVLSTALDQESRTDRSVDALVGIELDRHVKRILPEVDVESDYLGDYVGLRPGSDKRDYQIHVYPSRNWIAAAGIRSTGLTGKK